MNTAAGKFQIWRLKFNDFCTITNLKQQTPEYQLAIFRQSVSDDALKAIQKFKFQAHKDRYDWYVLMGKLEALCIGDRNETYERYKLFSRRQEDGESFESYLNTIEHLAETCNFGDLRDSSPSRDRIVTGLVNAAVTKQLLSIRYLTLSRCIDVCHSHFLAERQLSTMKHADLVLHKLQVTEPQKLQAVNCMFCGTRYTKNKECCPAWGKIRTKLNNQNVTISQSVAKAVLFIQLPSGRNLFPKIR